MRNPMYSRETEKALRTLIDDFENYLKSMGEKGEGLNLNFSEDVIDRIHVLMVIDKTRELTDIFGTLNALLTIGREDYTESILKLKNKLEVNSLEDLEDKLMLNSITKML